MKKEIDVLEYASTILKALKKGVLLTTKVGEKTNSMVISWGNLGIDWNKTIFTTYVRTNRFTKKQLDENPEFTINIPINGGLGKEIMKVCGTQSGHDIDKIKLLNLTLIENDDFSVPAIKEVPLTLECRVVYKQRQDEKSIGKAELEQFYPQEVGSDFHGCNRDLHTAYYGEIVRAYIVDAD